MPTLLHLSDLHRSPDEPIDNDTLLAAVVADVDRFSLNTERPEAIVVSGDLVQGATVPTSGYEREMVEQYRSAFDLIGRLCDELVEGDRSKVVVVPGNHDVCWNTSTASMEPVADDRYPKDLRRALTERDGPLRWSWRDRRLYRVTSDASYQRRLACYWDAVESFYEGVSLPLSLDRTRGFHLFSLFEGKAVFAGFETTHRNDHLRGEAELSTGVVSRCAMHLRRLDPQPSLVAAVWHHSVHGPPNRDDYLNVDVIREMAGLGFQIGFHGHQHLADSTDLAVSVGGGSSMSIVSAGSLCAGWRDLPRGTNRQYNIVRIDPSFERGTLHVREMAEGNQFVGRASGRFLGGEVPLAWTGRPGAATAAARAESRLREVTVAVEEATRRGRGSPLTDELASLRPAFGTYPRKVLLRALQNDEAWPTIVRIFHASEGVDEAVAVAEAAFRDGDLEALDAALAEGKVPPTFREDFETRRSLLSARRSRR